MILSQQQLDSIKKILIIQQKPFGDILLNTGYMPALREKFPNAQIDYLIQRPFRTILEDNPYLDNLVFMEKKKGWRYALEQFKTIINIRNRKYDLVIDQLRGTSTARFVFFSGAKYKLGFKLKPKRYFGFTFKRWNWIYNLNPPRGEMRYYSRLKFDLLAPLGIQEIDHNLFYHTKEESFTYIKHWLTKANLFKEKLIVFSPGTPVKRKQWSLDHYAELADLIHEKTEFKIILLWGPGELEDCKYIQSKMKSEVIIAPPTTFNQAAALLNFVKVLIGNDGGINHLAVSQETPSIAIFGPTSSPKKWSAWHTKQHLYLRDANFKTKNDSTFNVKPQLVFDALEKLLTGLKKQPLH